ncbi:MAG: phospholipid carrier-dependent glycosyltransferase [Brasilonema octagenarum HA4186-MV1]|jgi:4-amino-4-deoxy-L-arabinose transferase-like glycosyltransferase|nr:phospholipid carrier-dependent glycosyltransferase [Brasilonema octagenarum HA4186-MV1]
MSNYKSKQNKYKNLFILGIIWLLGALCDRIWFALDRSVPAWDQADYLTGSLNYWHALQNPQWFNQEWWQSFWLLSSKIPPLTYIVTAIVQNIFGIEPDQATLMMLFFSAILLTSVYGLGTVLFSETVGLWAAALCQILPALYLLRLEFLLDYPLAAVVTLSFFCFTVWRMTVDKGVFASFSFPTSPTPPTQWFWAAAFGLTLGLALMVKQTALFFLLTPIVWVGVGALRHRRWGRLLQLLGSLCFSVLVFGPWYRTNWLIILTSGKRATIDSAIAERQPGLDKLESWMYYWNQLPYQVSLPLLFVPLVSLLIWWGRSKFASENPKLETIPSSKANQQNSSLIWLLVFCIGGYFLSCLNVNKHERYVLPYLPPVTVLLAYGLTRWRSLFGQRVRWGTFGLAIILMLLNLFPVGGVVGGWMTQVLSPNSEHYPYMKAEFPHQQVIGQIIQTEPYLRSTLGVLPSTGEVNQHNFNYYGALQNFQVYGRQVGIRKKFVEQDARSLSWFVTKTGNQGPVKEAQALMVKTVEQGGNFQLNKSWNLPDNSQLMLYHQQTPTLKVRQTSQQNSQAKIALSQVIVPEKAPPGVPIPVSYEWSGSWDELQHGLVLLTWRKNGQIIPNTDSWIHDHGIAMGAMHPGAKKPEGTFQVIEKMAMLPPSTLAPGTYTLDAIYLNRLSGESYPLSVPKVTLQIDPQAPAIQAPELDLVTQLETLGAQLPKGTEALTQVFDEVGRINQYDPIQDYLVQARLTLEYRLQHFTQNRDWAYALALANVLQRRVDGAIASLKQVTHLDPENPYPHAYLAFVQLYNWQPRTAEKSLEPSLAKNPNLPEFRVLSGVAALMQGNFVKAWKDLSTLRK